MDSAFRRFSLCVGALGLALLATACNNDGATSESVCVRIGSDGGLVTTADDVLTIALQPGALAETTEICVRKDDDPPDVFGPAYRVSPNVPLALPSTLSYRWELPAQTADVTVGRIDRDDYEAGKGKWIPLPRLTVDVENGLVKSSDEELALFYALLDEGGSASTSAGDATDTGNADEPGDSTSVDPSTTGGTTQGDGSTTAAITSGPESTTSEGGVEESSSSKGSTEDTGVIDYPPECDDLYMGPYGILFAGQIAPNGGSEDLAMSGDSDFVIRDGPDLLRIDSNADPFPYPLDVPFVNRTLGLRYRADGDLIAAMDEIDEIWRIEPNGDTSVFFTGIDFPNGVYPDADGYVWATEFEGDRVHRIDPDGSGSTIIAQGAAADAANGIVYDDLRGFVFWTKYTDSQLWRAPIAEDGTPGAPVMVADLEGFSDGLALDICGNLYVVNEGGGGPSNIDRVFVDVDGEQVGDVELIIDSGIDGATQLTNIVANAQFGYGDLFMDTDALYTVGLPGTVFVVDVRIDGHPIAPLQ